MQLTAISGDEFDGVRLSARRCPPINSSIKRSAIKREGIKGKNGSDIHCNQQRLNILFLPLAHISQIMSNCFPGLAFLLSV